eukprot:3658800-Pyramimonas_sp.AAC.1
MNLAGAPAVPTAAGQPATSPSAAVAMGSTPVVPQMALAFPPSRYEMGESTLERQARVRPSATPPIINDGGFTTCAICLEEFVYHDK